MSDNVFDPTQPFEEFTLSEDGTLSAAPKKPARVDSPSTPSKTPTTSDKKQQRTPKVRELRPGSNPFRDEDFPEYTRLVMDRRTTPDQLSRWTEERGYGRSSNAAEILAFHRRNPKIRPVNTFIATPPEAPAPDGMPQPGTATDWVPDVLQDDIERLGLSLGIIDPSTYYGLGNYGPNARRPNTPATASSSPLPSWGERFRRSAGETFSEAGEGINAYILRTNKDQQAEEAIRRYGSDHNWSGEQIDAAIRRDREDRGQAIEEIRAQRSLRDNDEVRREEGLGVDPETGEARSSWWGWAKRGSADLSGTLVGDTNPSYFINPALRGAVPIISRAAPAVAGAVGRVLPSAAARVATQAVERGIEAAAPTVASAAGQGGVQAAIETGIQADEVDRGIRDSINPVEVGVHGLLGFALQGGAEGLGKLAPNVARWITGRRGNVEGTVSEPAQLSQLDRDLALLSEKGLTESHFNSVDEITSAAARIRATKPETQPALADETSPVVAPDATVPKPEEVPVTSTPEVAELDKDVVTRLTEALQNAGKATEQQKQLYAAERAKRFAQVKEAQANGGGRKAYEESLKAMKGELPKAEFESVKSKFSDDEIVSLFDHISYSNLSPDSKLSAHAGLERLLTGSGVQPKQLDNLSQVFPPDFIKAALKNRSSIKKAGGIASELWNTPKSLQATADFSGMLRQGLGLIHRDEWWDSLVPMVKATVNPKTAADLDAGIRAHPNYDVAQEAGLSITSTGKLGHSEDMFRSHIAERLPVWGKVVRGSERAYVSFLNKLRFDTFNSLLKQAEAAGEDMSDPAIAKGIARYINVMTGRGGVGGQELNTALNQVFYSPGLISSRLQILTAPVTAPFKAGFIAEMPKSLRKEAVKSYAAITGFNATTLSLALLAGKSVELDPLSSDFLKLKDGNTRLDFGGGLTQYITLAARALTKQSKSSGENGSTRDLERQGDTALDNDLKFVMNKMHPTLTLLLDQQRGKTAVGEPFEWQKAIIDRLTPMGFPDIADTLKEQGPAAGTFYSLLGLIGVSLANYESKGDTPKTKEAPAFDPSQPFTEEVETITDPGPEPEEVPAFDPNQPFEVTTTANLGAVDILKGMGLTPTDEGVRSYEDQERYYKQSKGVAKPGTSPHEFGNAVDIKVPKGVKPRDIVAAFQDQGYKGVTIITRRHGTGPHWHIQWDSAPE